MIVFIATIAVPRKKKGAVKTIGDRAQLLGELFSKVIAH